MQKFIIFAHSLWLQKSSQDLNLVLKGLDSLSVSSPHSYAAVYDPLIQLPLLIPSALECGSHVVHSLLHLVRTISVVLHRLASICSTSPQSFQWNRVPEKRRRRGCSQRSPKGYLWVRNCGKYYGVKLIVHRWVGWIWKPTTGIPICFLAKETVHIRDFILSS